MLRCHTQMIIIVYIVPLMRPDKTQTHHMHVGQFRRRRINQYLVRRRWRWCWKGNIYPGGENDVCDKAAILGGEEANKADLTVVTIPRRVLWGGQMAAVRRADPHCDGGRLAGRAARRWS